MISQATILAVFQSVIELIIPGLKVIWANDQHADAPRPLIGGEVPSYAAIEIQEDYSPWATAYEETTTTVSGDLVEQIRALPTEGTLAVEFYGADAHTYARRLRLSHNRADVLRLLVAAGDYSMEQPSQVSDSPVIRSATREPGASITFVVKWVDSEIFDTEGVDTITPTVSVT